MRKVIAGMQISLDGKFGGPDGYADWVHAWSDNYGVTPEVDACLLGGGMYPGYEQYWTAVQNGPDESLPMTGKLPTPGEIEWGRFAARTPHYVLSNTLMSANWPQTQFVRRVDDIAALKRQGGKGIYLVGGGATVASLIDAGLVDELRLAVHPLIVGDGKALFAKIADRRALELRTMQELPGGRVGLVYAIG
jgi:dihydrofolate reductase